jgi:hypothetical protein
MTRTLAAGARCDLASRVHAECTRTLAAGARGCLASRVHAECPRTCCGCQARPGFPRSRGRPALSLRVPGATWPPAFTRMTRTLAAGARCDLASRFHADDPHSRCGCQVRPGAYKARLAQPRAPARASARGLAAEGLAPNCNPYEASGRRHSEEVVVIRRATCLSEQKSSKRKQSCRVGPFLHVRRNRGRLGTLPTRQKP